jgi:thiol-disulfide isomerase/thioredoxin
MKSAFYLLLLLAIMFSCKEKSSTTYISAKLPDVKNQILELVSIDNYFKGIKKDENYTFSKTDSTGLVHFKVKDITPGFYQILTGSYPLLQYDIYLDKGDSIFIEQSAWKDEPNLNITGKGAEKHSHLIEDYKLFADGPSFRDKIVSNRFTTVIDFKRFIDSIFNPRFQQLKLHQTNDTTLINHLKHHLKIERANLLLTHLEYRNYYMNDEFKYYIPNEAYVSFLDSIHFNNDHHIDVKEIESFAINQLTYITKKILQENPELESKAENLNLRWKYLLEQNPSAWNDVMALSTIKSFSFAMLEDGFFDEFSDFESRLDSLFYLPKNKQLFDLNAKPYLKLAPGQPAPNFALPDVNDEIYKLSDFIGKIVYIDFWGTWCGPCIAEIPSSIELHEKYKNEPVVFLNIALEAGPKQIEEWKDFIKGKSDYAKRVMDGKVFTGIHLVAENQFRNKEVEDYLLNFAPTYVLIDQEGKIVNPRAPRPNYISEDIDQLLENM